MNPGQTLNRWLTNAARRDHATIQAAVMIVCDGARGDLAQRLGDAIETETEPDTEQAWINWPTIFEAAIGFSGGERRLLAVAASLAGGHPVDLADALSGLDPRNAELVAHAVALALDVDLARLTEGHR